MWGSSGVPRRPEWGVRTHAVHLFRTPYLEHGCPQQTHPWVIAPMGQPLQHEAKQWGTHCLGLPYVLTVNPPPHIPLKVSLWGSYQHDCRATRTVVMGHAQHFRPSPMGILPQGGHHQLIQGPDPFLRQRVPGNWKVQTLPLLPWQQPLHLMAIPALLQLPLHCPFPLHPKQYRQQRYLPFVSPKPLSCLNQLTHQGSCSDYRSYQCPLSNSSPWGLPFISINGNWTCRWNSWGIWTMPSLTRPWPIVQLQVQPLRRPTRAMSWH